MPETVFIGFGSNVGDRLDFCDRSVTLLSLLPRSQVVGVSLLYETEPVKDHAQPGEGWFLNGVVQLETDITPKSLLAVLGKSSARSAEMRKTGQAPEPSIWTSCSTANGLSMNQISWCRILACTIAGLSSCR